MPTGADDDIPEEPDDGPPGRRGSTAGESAAPLTHLERRMGDDADVLVPDGVPLAQALARTTDLGIGAHPDDLELLMVAPIGTCRAAPDRWFTGVTVTDGAGSVKTGPFAGLSDGELAAVRREEQRTAAMLGGYGAMVQLGRSSATVRDPSRAGDVVDGLEAILRAARPVNVYTHNPADKHGTHVAVAAAVIRAVRRLPADQRPWRLVGVEGWRDLDWLGDVEKVHLDASAHTELAHHLAACHASQLDGKRYDRATAGRRQANATFTAPCTADEATEVSFAMDLTPLVRNDDIDPVGFVAAAIERFRDATTTSLRDALGAG